MARAGNRLLAPPPLKSMITLRRANERGHFDHGWLDAYHTFSFADYPAAARRNGATLGAGDGAAISGERDVVVAAAEPAEVLPFHLA